MLSIKQCREILERDGATYSVDEVKRIRDFLYQLGYLDYEHYVQKISQEEGRHIHPRLNGQSSREGV